MFIVRLSVERACCFKYEAGFWQDVIVVSDTQVTVKVKFLSYGNSTWYLCILLNLFFIETDIHNLTAINFDLNVAHIDFVVWFIIVSASIVFDFVLPNVFCTSN